MMFKFAVWRPSYSEVEVEASSYDEAIKLAKAKARELRAAMFQLGDSNETVVMPENLKIFCGVGICRNEAAEGSAFCPNHQHMNGRL